MDIEPDVVAFIHIHLLQGPAGLGRGLHHVLLAAFHDVQVGAGLGRTHDVLNQACENAGVVGARLPDG